jgi:hypothetical protein
VTVDLINQYSDYGSGAASPAADSSLIVSRAASSSVASSWAIPVGRLLRSIEGLAPPIPAQEADNRTTAQQNSVPKTAQQEPENMTAQPLVTPPALTPPSIASGGTESPRPEQSTPSDKDFDLLVATNPASPIAATGAVAVNDIETRLQSVLKETKAIRMKGEQYKKDNASSAKY